MRAELVITQSRHWLGSLERAAAALMGPRFWAVFGLLLLVDVAVIAAHLAWSHGVVLEWGGLRVPFADVRWFNIGQERGYAEMLEGLSGGLAALCLVLAWRADRQPVYLGLAVVFTLVVADNLLQVHERLGILLAGALGGEANSLLRHGGEAVAFLLLGGLIAGVLAATYRRSGARARIHATLGFAILIVLGGFAAGIDAVHALASRLLRLSAQVDDLVTLLEDGGETVALSAGLAYATAVHADVRTSPA